MVILNVGDVCIRLSLRHRFFKLGDRRAFWICDCSCGFRGFETREMNLVKAITYPNGGTRSCGCLRRERNIERSLTHGACQKGEHSHEYASWCAMIQRCRHKKYKNYAGRGIKVCGRWKDSFVSFLEDMGTKPTPRHTLDRFPNNNGDYEPGNCRWATYTEQLRNTRRNKSLTVGGVTKPIWKWAKLNGLGHGVIEYRLRVGWGPKRAVTTPSLRKNYPKVKV